MGWEKVADNIHQYRENFRTHNNGEEAPPINCADFVACTEDAKRAEEIARVNIVGYYWSVMEHYEMTGDHFAETGKSYAHYANAAQQMKAAGMDAVVEDFLSANLWGTPTCWLRKCANAARSSATLRSTAASAIRAALRRGLAVHAPVRQNRRTRDSQLDAQDRPGSG